jgi:hypothetical protein
MPVFAGNVSEFVPLFNYRSFERQEPAKLRTCYKKFASNSLPVLPLLALQAA